MIYLFTAVQLQINHGLPHKYSIERPTTVKNKRRKLKTNNQMREKVYLSAVNAKQMFLVEQKNEKKRRFFYSIFCMFIFVIFFLSFFHNDEHAVEEHREGKKHIRRKLLFYYISFMSLLHPEGRMIEFESLQASFLSISFLSIEPFFSFILS